jgi:cholesterol transport system auxiliary component
MSGPQTLVVSPAVIAVAMPGGPRALMGSDIAWRTNGVFRYVAGAEWAGRAPDMLQAALADAVDGAGVVRAGVRAGSGVRSDYEIAWDITAFQVEEEDGRINARFAAVARLVDARTRALLAQTRVDEVRPVADRSQALATEALESATRDAVARIARELAPVAATSMAAAAPAAS